MILKKISMYPKLSAKCVCTEDLGISKEGVCNAKQDRVLWYFAEKILLIKKILDQVCASCQVKYSTSQRFLLFVCLLFVPLYRIFHSYESSQVRSCCGNGHRAPIRSSMVVYHTYNNTGEMCHETHTCCWTFDRGTITTCFNDSGLSRPGFEHLTSYSWVIRLWYLPSHKLTHDVIFFIIPQPINNAVSKKVL